MKDKNFILQFVLLIFLVVIASTLSVAFSQQTVLSVQTTSEAPLDLTTLTNSDPVNGMRATNENGDVFFFVDNPDASSAVITFTAQIATKEVPGYGPLTKSNLSVTLAGGESKMVGPFPARAWNDASGDILISFSGDASDDLDLAAIRYNR